MATIDELLEQAARAGRPETAAAPPTLEQLRRHRDRKRRHRVFAGATASVLLLLLAGAAVRERSSSQRVTAAAIADAPDGDSSEGENGAEATSPSSTTPSSTTPATADVDATDPAEAPDDPTTTSPASDRIQDNRVFLLAPEFDPRTGGEVVHFDVYLETWAGAVERDDFIGDSLILADNPGNPLAAVVANLYFVPDVTISRIGGHEGFDGGLQYVNDGEERLRVGFSQDRVEANVFRAFEVGGRPGVLAALTVGLERQEAIELAIAAEVADIHEKWSVDVAVVPDGLPPLQVATVGAASPALDYTGSYNWEIDGSQYGLQVADGPLVGLTGLRRSTGSTGIESVEVRGVDGVFVAGTEHGYHWGDAVYWEERGRTLSLSTQNVQPRTETRSEAEVDAARVALVALADRLQWITQAEIRAWRPELVMADQESAVRSWLVDPGLPSSTPIEPMLTLPPLIEHEAAWLVAQYQECAWLQEWNRAGAQGDNSAKRVAEEVLDGLAGLPAVVAHDRAMAELGYPNERPDEPYNFAGSEAWRC